MSGWYSLNLGDGILAGEPLRHLEERFSSLAAQTGIAKDMAIFVRHESSGDLHCEVVAYLSPASVALAREFGAGPCAKPSADGLSLLAGPDDAWAVHFPGRRE